MRNAIPIRWRLPGVAKSAAVVVFALFVAGCASMKGVGAPGGQNSSASLPDGAAVVGAYNARVRDLHRLRAPVTLIINSPKEGGGRSKDQVEGNLQFVLPSSLALRIDKVGQALAYMGSNEQQYWWFDLGDAKRAFVGTHALASIEKARRFGLPVLPLDLIELAGVTPLPNASVLAMSWTTDGTLVVRVPARWGSRRLLLNAKTYEPVRIEIIERSGHVAVASDLSLYQGVKVDTNAFSTARIAGKIEVKVADADVQATIAIVEPQNPGDRLRMKAFDLTQMLESYNIKDVRDMDSEPPPADPSQPGTGGQ